MKRFSVRKHPKNSSYWVAWDLLENRIARSYASKEMIKDVVRHLNKSYKAVM